MKRNRQSFESFLPLLHVIFGAIWLVMGLVWITFWLSKNSFGGVILGPICFGIGIACFVTAKILKKRLT
jgi:hypothetical protein